MDISSRRSDDGSKGSECSAAGQQLITLGPGSGGTGSFRDAQEVGVWRDQQTQLQQHLLYEGFLCLLIPHAEITPLLLCTSRTVDTHLAQYQCYVIIICSHQSMSLQQMASSLREKHFFINVSLLPNEILETNTMEAFHKCMIEE